MNHRLDELTKSVSESVMRCAALKRFGIRLGGMALATLLFATAAQARPPAPPAQTNSAISWSEIGAKAGVDYKGDGLTVSGVPQSGSARLHTFFNASMVRPPAKGCG